MAVPMALFAVATGLQVFGQWQANLAQAQAERDNAAWLMEQAQFAQEAGEREALILQNEGKQLLGEQAGTFLANGVELTGSALDVLDTTRNQIGLELDAIKRNTQMQVREATLKAASANFTSAQLSSPMNNLLQASGTVASNAGTMLSMQARSDRVAARNKASLLE